jgi:asparagine synthetase B (glutamine-hydrolysing)
MALSGELYSSRPRDLLEAYVEQGDRAIDGLDGSFVLFIWDGRSARATLATDFCGSRPMFYAPWRGGIAFAPEISSFAELGRELSTLDASAAVTFLIHGHLLDDQSWIEGVRPLAPGTVLTIDRQGQTSERQYFQMGPRPARAADVSEEEYRRQLADLLRAAVSRRFQGVDDFVLPLSGGIDSRGILGCVLELGLGRLKTVSWGIDETTSGADAWVARKLAERFGTEHTFLRRRTEDLPRDVDEMVGRVSALTDDAALHHHELNLMRRIRDELDGLHILRGDECFGFGGASASDHESLARVGLSQLDHAIDVQSLLPAERLTERVQESSALLQLITDSCSLKDFTDRKDAYYSTQRLPHYLHRSSYYKLTVLNLRNPWLDRSVLEFIWGVPTPYRVHKQLFVRTLEDMFPDLMTMPTASSHSLEDWTSVIQEDEQIASYLSEHLVNGAGALEPLLDAGKVSDYVRSALDDRGRRNHMARRREAIGRLARVLLPERVRSALKTRFINQALRHSLPPGILVLRLLILRKWTDRVRDLREAM